MPKNADSSLTKDEVRVQVPMSPDAIERIDELADRMGIGRGRMAAMLLEEGLRDNEWIIRVVTSSFMKPVVKLIKKWPSKKEPSHGKDEKGELA